MIKTNNECIFCGLEESRIAIENDLGVVIYDNYPVSKGHALIIPKRHISSLSEAKTPEVIALFSLIDEAKKVLVERYKPTGFNIGINDGASAGQTVMHLHIHVIPRYQGDQEDPRGGVRWIFPEKAKYWE
jgi:diadenosine tetraphosphate (Ap4A) HIT family hydrolase